MKYSEKRILSTVLALLMAAEAAPLPAFAADAQPIQTVSFGNLNTALRVGAAPEFTTYLTDDAALHASIRNEGWSCAAEPSIGVSRTDGLPVPEEPVNSAYNYALLLTADEGWYFPEDMTLEFDGCVINSDNYYVKFYDGGEMIMLICYFIPPVVPLAAETEQISYAYIDDITFRYQAGDAPCFSAASRAPEQYQIAYECLTDALAPERFLYSDETYNNMRGLTAENRLTALEAGREYSYGLKLVPAYGYEFAEYVTVFLNDWAYYAETFNPGEIILNPTDLITAKAPDTTTTTTTTIATTSTTTTEATTTTESTAITTTTEPTTTTTEITAATTTLQTVPYDPDRLYGDVNQDGMLSVADAVLLIRLVAEDSWLSLSDEGQLAADVDHDGILTLLDCTALLRLLTFDTDAPETPPQRAETDGSETEIPDFGDYTWLFTPTGNSSAFTEKPFDALTVSAEENVLSYDGQLQFSEFSQEDFDQAEALLGDAPALLLDGWNIEAGLKPDEHLPGYYSCTYDLSQLGIPEELYDDICLLRVADDGTVTEYATERDGASLYWESDQNSASLVVLSTILAGVICAGIYKLYQARDKIWSEEELKAPLKWAKTPFCYIQYADLEAAPEDQAREERMKKKYNQAKEAVRQQATEQVENDWIAWAYSSVAFSKEVNRKIAVLAEEYLKNDAEYQADLEIENGVPADVALVAEQFERAYFYLRFQEGCPTLGGTRPAIYFGAAVKGDGYAYKPVSGAQYICLNRSTNQCRHVAVDTPFSDIYKTLVNAKTADRYLITLTHELFHIYQNLKLSTHVRKYLKFSEMSAAVIEHRAGAYYLKNNPDTFTAYEENITDKYETYGLPLEEHGKSADMLIPTGYTLSHFWEYIETYRKKQYKGWEIILAFEKNKSILKTLNDIYGYDVNSYDVLGAFWKKFQKEQEWSDKEIDRAGTVEEHTRRDHYEDDDVIPYFPSLMNIAVFENDRTQVHFAVGHQDFTCRQTFLKSKTKNWSVILVRDENFGEMQPVHTFLIPNGTDGKPIGNETKNGVVMVSDNQDLQYREIQCAGTVGKSGYTVHFIPAPETPQVSFDEENEQFTVQLKSAPSKEGASGLTDHFLLVCRVDGTETAAIPVSYDDWQQELILKTEDIHLNIRQKCKLEIAVCEAIDAEGEFAEGRCAASVPFAMEFGTLDFPVIDQEISPSGKYGCVSIERNSGSRFTLDAEGNFTFEMTASSGEDEPIRENNPFSLYSAKWDYSGFIVRGKVTNAESPTDWEAEIESCSVSTFTACLISDEKLWGSADENGELVYLGISHQESDWSGAFDGAPSGTLKFTGHGSTAMIKVTLDVPQLTGSEDTETEGSVTINAMVYLPS